MKNIDLKLTCKKIEIDGWDCDYKSIGISLDSINSSDLNNVEVAQCIELDTMFEAHSEADILSYVKANYDWFDTETED